MRRIIVILFVVPCLVFSLEGKTRTTSLTADFSGANKDRVYNIFTCTGYTTTVVMPEKRSAKHVVCGDVSSWRMECDGKFIFLKPLRHSLHTSLTIVTHTNRVYIFNLIEDSGKSRDYEITAKVNIKDEPEVLVQVNREVKPAGQQEQGFPFSPLKAKNHRYRVKKNRFFVEKVFDDGIFTYIYMPRAQVKPAIFIKRGRGKEAVKYVDSGDWVVVHTVIQKGEKILLIVGSRRSKIIRRR